MRNPRPERLTCLIATRPRGFDRASGGGRDETADHARDDEENDEHEHVLAVGDRPRVYRRCEEPVDGQERGEDRNEDHVLHATIMRSPTEREDLLDGFLATACEFFARP